jgi:hypothetical protein
MAAAANRAVNELPSGIGVVPICPALLARGQPNPFVSANGIDWLPLGLFSPKVGCNFGASTEFFLAPPHIDDCELLSALQGTNI